MKKIHSVRKRLRKLIGQMNSKITNDGIVVTRGNCAHKCYFIKFVVPDGRKGLITYWPIKKNSFIVYIDGNGDYCESIDNIRVILKIRKI